MTPELSQVLAEMAQQFGTTVPYLWEVMVRQARVEAIVGLAQGAGLVLGWLAFWRWVPRILASWNMEIDSALDAIGGIVVGAALIVLSVIWVCFLGSIVTALLNPEFYAIRQILSAL